MCVLGCVASVPTSERIACGTDFAPILCQHKSLELTIVPRPTATSLPIDSIPGYKPGKHLVAYKHAEEGALARVFFNESRVLTGLGTSRLNTKVQREMESVDTIS